MDCKEGVEVENCEAIELTQSEVARLIEIAHREGLTDWQLLDIFLKACVALHMQGTNEYGLKGGQ